MSFKKIFVAIDPSPLTEAIFKEALNLAQKESANLMLFHCMTWEATGEVVPMMGTGMGLEPMGGSTLQPLQQQQLQWQIQKSQELLQRYAQIAADAGIVTEFDYKVGDPGSWICDMAINWGADLIVMGRRGRKGMTEMLLGSVSNHVVHNAGCSVLIVQGATLEELPESV